MWRVLLVGLPCCRPHTPPPEDFLVVFGTRSHGGLYPLYYT